MVNIVYDKYRQERVSNHIKRKLMKLGGAQMKPLTEGALKAGSTLKRNRFWFKAFQQRYLYMMSLPFVIWIFIFSYVPVWGWLTAFQNYKPKDSILDQKWVGFEN